MLVWVLHRDGTKWICSLWWSVIHVNTTQSIPHGKGLGEELSRLAGCTSGVFLTGLSAVGSPTLNVGKAVSWTGVWPQWKPGWAWHTGICCCFALQLQT